jgi:hypothetical protein
MVTFDEFINKLCEFITSGVMRDYAIKLLISLHDLTQDQRQLFASQLNDHIMRIAPEVTSHSNCPLEGSTLEYEWEIYIYRAIWYVCCYAKHKREILTVDSPCIIVLFACLKMREGYNISYVLSYFHSETRHLENEAVQV